MKAEIVFQATYYAEANEHYSLENKVLHDEANLVRASNTLRNATKQKWKLNACERAAKKKRMVKRMSDQKRTSQIIKKVDVTNPIMPGDILQSEERPTAMAHANMPITAMKATMRALVLTLPSLILFQIPPQKLAQQPGSDIDAISA
jgi:hypothetical protein